jgi:hypothetical protein
MTCVRMTVRVVQGDDVVVQGLAVCRKPESHTVPVVQGLTVCKMPGSHTVPVGRGLTVCAKLGSHTDDVVV